MQKTKNVEEWLSEYKKAKTGRVVWHRLQVFLAESGLTVADLEAKSGKEIKHAVLQWQKSQEGKKPNNTILAIITSVRAFSSYLEKPIKFRRGQLVSQKMATGYHDFSNGDLGKMYNSADIGDKALLAVGVSLGWEVSAILQMETEYFRQLVTRAKSEKQDFISFESQRGKTGKLRFGILNPLALKALDEYFTKNNPTGKLLFEMTKKAPNIILRKLAKRAGIVLVGDVRWHNLRSWYMSKLSDAGFNAYQIKLILGKAIPITDRTYLRTLQQEIMRRYPKAYIKYLSILKYQTLNQIEELEKLKAEVETLKATMRAMAMIYGDEILAKAKQSMGFGQKADMDAIIKLVEETMAQNEAEES